MDQEVLQGLLLESIRSRGYELGDVTAQGEDGTLQAAIPEPTHVLVVMQRFELGAFLGALVHWLGRLEPAAKAAWYKGFTRTVFLAGAPSRLKARFPDLAYVHQDDVAWTWPGSGVPYETLRRLLKPLRTSRGPDVPPVLDWQTPGPATGRDLQLELATGGLVLEQYLVHLHHAVSETFILGRMSAGDRVRITHVADIDQAGPGDWLRVQADPVDRSRLRAFARLRGLQESAS